MLSFREIPLGGGQETLCRHCVRAEDVTWSVEAATDLLGRALSSDLAAGILFTQTDAITLEQLLALAARCAEAGVGRIGVRMSGRLVSDEHGAIRLLQGGVRVAEVGFAGPEASQHDALTGIPGSFDAASAAVSALTAAGEALGVRVAVRGRVAVCTHNLHSLPATVMSCAQMGVSSILLACDPKLDPRRSAEWVAAACDTGTVNRVWVAVSGMPKESLGAMALHANDVMSMSGAQA